MISKVMGKASVKMLAIVCLLLVTLCSLIRGSAVDHAVCPPPSCHWITDQRYPPAGLLKARMSGVEAFCHYGASTSNPDFVTSIWKRINVHIETSDAPEHNFIVYTGHNYSDVLASKQATDAVWFQWPWHDSYIDVSPYGVQCWGLTFRSVDIKYLLNIHTTRIYYRFPLLLFAGLLLFFLAPSLSQNIALYYASTTTVGVLAFLLVLVFVVSRLVPHKGATYTLLLGGWAASAYFFSFIVENARDVVLYYRTALYIYIGVSAVLSAAYCYWKGPPSNPRSLKLIQLLFQSIALALIYNSSQSRLISIGLVVVTMVIYWIDYIIPRFLRTWLITKWYIWFPEERKLLTEEEFYEQGRVETEKALRDLRQYLHTPGSSPWHVIRRLKDPTRFASFVEGEDHLSEEEVFRHERDQYTTRDGLMEHRLPTLQLEKDDAE